MSPKYLNETVAEVTSTKAPRNQVEALEKELKEAHYQIKHQQEELLGLYRKLYASDRSQY